MKKLPYLFATLLLIFSVSGCGNSNELLKQVSSQTSSTDAKSANDSTNQPTSQPTNQNKPNLVTKTAPSSMCLLSLDEFNSVSKEFKFIAGGNEVYEYSCGYLHYENGEADYSIKNDVIGIEIRAGRYTDDMTGRNAANAPEDIGFEDRESVVPSRKGFYDIACDEGKCISNTERDIATTGYTAKLGPDMPDRSIILYDDCWIEVRGSGTVGVHEKLVKAIAHSDVFKGKCALLQTVQEAPKKGW